MIIYNPLDGNAITSAIPSKPRHCFLMTKLGPPVPRSVCVIHDAVTELCTDFDYRVIDANSRITGRDFLLKIWKLIASAPLSVGISHEDIPEATQANIYYEIGIAQALGKETLLIKSPKARLPSDFIRTEYVEFNDEFRDRFNAYLASLLEQAEHYEIVADQLDRNPILAIDYLKRAFLISGDEHLRNKARGLLDEAGLDDRARNSVELLAADF
ncbi:MAG: hypothetical protein BECKG1743D_GA0114223_100403 [Candidatus Kentron sp. G]|nr:MAG: hypothetical protein BECKG1743F_GA0114225_100492 [Candidatus Kentron sp. G]VFM96035.1 MAG: hypothetical protein BECKG1743E_GA0114224_100327 [Candidatus Kentron sp. G]VFM97980.1 MAG: hypothetical protein BECKG1743D_GA0114223_100403 [Candidatus Kentron sp. G]